MTNASDPSSVTVGVLALQGAFSEHIQLLRKATTQIQTSRSIQICQVRTMEELDACDALILPGGESTTMSLVAERSGMLEPLREFVKVQRRPVWGTCAGMILLAEEANRVKKGGQELIGGLDVRVNRNHFGRQVESFETNLQIPFLGPDARPFHTVFIRAPIVESLLPATPHSQSDTVHAPSKSPKDTIAASFTSPHDVEVLARLPNAQLTTEGEPFAKESESTIVAVRQGNCFATSFHPELSTDARIHMWWLERVIESVEQKEALVAEKS